MSRVLTIRRVTVPSARVEEYRKLVAALAQRLAARHQHLWVFRLRGDQETWLEFVEAAEQLHPRAIGPADAVEADLEAQLRALAPDDDVTPEIWDEVRFPET